MNTQEQRYTRRLVYLALFVGMADAARDTTGAWRAVDVVGAAIWFSLWAAYCVQGFAVWVRR